MWRSNSEREVINWRPRAASVGAGQVPDRPTLVQASALGTRTVLDAPAYRGFTRFAFGDGQYAREITSTF